MKTESIEIELIVVNFVFLLFFFFGEICTSGGAAEKTGKLSVGNEIITINGQSTAQMTRVGVWNFMKTLPMGPILMVIKS